MRDELSSRSSTIEVLEDCFLDYPNGKGQWVTCRVRMYRTANSHVLIATDAGFFLSETIDRVASIMVRRWEVDPARLRVVEHFDARFDLNRPAAQPAETFAYVAFDWAGMIGTNPTWQETSRASVQELLGEGVTW